MARAPLNSTGRFEVQINDESGSTYACDCGQEYMSEEALIRHQQINCTNRSLKCSFCQEPFPSSTTLRDHLLLCGNKTDQCPNCNQFIRRSHFAYHYENSCASVDKVETPPPSRPRSRSGQRLPPNYNKPIAREDIPSDDFDNYPNQNSPIYPSRGNGRVPTPRSNPSNSPVIIECEYCRHGCKQSDYRAHKDNCLKNPANVNNRLPIRIPLKPNQSQGASNGVVHIPCEFCNQLVDLPNWSSHTQSCRERDNQRVANLARSISQEPVTEQFPCEYCQRLYPAKQLGLHEVNCIQNPANTNAAANLGRRPPARVFLPVKPKNNGSHAIPPDNRSPRNPRNVHYQSIDIERTHAANRSFNKKSTNQYAIRRTASDDAILHSDGSPDSVRAYGNGTLRPNEHRSYDDIAHPYQQRPSNGTALRPRSTSKNSRNSEKHQDPRGNAAGNRSPYYNDSKHRQQLHHRPGSYKVIDNHPDYPVEKRKKPSFWKDLFGCGTNTHGTS